MRGTKYLLYPGALLVAIWGINGVTDFQPDTTTKPGAAVLSAQNIGPSVGSRQKTSVVFADTGGRAR